MGVALVNALVVSVASAGDLTQPLERGELFSYFGGKTQILENGGAYYAEDGTLQVLRDAELFRGSWSSTNAGEVCWHLFDWDEIPCNVYHLDGERIVVLRDGQTVPAPALQAGNTLKHAKATVDRDPHLARTKRELPERDLFSRDETIAFLSGRTSLRAPNGRMYYAPDFTLKTNWNGVRKTGTWSVTADGGVCWTIAGWGPTPCEYYFYKEEDGILWARFRGADTAAAEHVDGDRTELK